MLIYSSFLLATIKANNRYYTLKAKGLNMFMLRPLLVWCPDPDLNQGHEDFQSSALPTELSGHSFKANNAVKSAYNIVKNYQ